jgi:hypothetical protein
MYLIPGNTGVPRETQCLMVQATRRKTGAGREGPVFRDARNLSGPGLLAQHREMKLTTRRLIMTGTKNDMPIPQRTKAKKWPAP